MREAKLRVKQITYNNGTTTYYGNVITKKVVEDYHISDFDKRKDIAPCGLNATISIDRGYNDIDGNKIDEKDVLDIKISANYLEHGDENRYFAFFHIEDRVYEVCIWFENNSIKSVVLSEWLNVGDFKDCNDADNIYYSDEHFISFENYFC